MDFWMSTGPAGFPVLMLDVLVAFKDCASTRMVVADPNQSPESQAISQSAKLGAPPLLRRSKS